MVIILETVSQSISLTKNKQLAKLANVTPGVKDMDQFEKLVEVIAKLRHPKDGCPWDLKQTHQSLLKYLIEESYEYLEAVEKKDPEKMEEELGDVLLQVLLHCRIGEENSTFNLESVSKSLAEKLIRRHPHIFSKVEAGLSADQVVTKWNEIKEKEKGKKKKTHIDSSFLNYPALLSAYEIGNKTSKINFDWNNHHDVIEVVQSEWDELKEELHQNDTEKIEEEMGDLLFSMAQLARHLNIDPETTLRNANKKFIRRFQKMEEFINNDNIVLETLSQQEMAVYGDKVKKNEA